MVQWQDASFPSLRRGFDSLHPLHFPRHTALTRDEAYAAFLENPQTNSPYSIKSILISSMKPKNFCQSGCEKIFRDQTLDLGKFLYITFVRFSVGSRLILSISSNDRLRRPLADFRPPVYGSRKNLNFKSQDPSPGVNNLLRHLALQSISRVFQYAQLG